jgi:integrase
MARTIEKLSPAKVQRAKRPGLLGDGAGLWLHIGPTGGKSWVYRYMLDGRAREMGLGPLHTIGLAEARELAREARKLCLAGVDPLETRHAARDARRLEAAKAITFKSCAEKFIAANRSGWRNAKHAAQWTATLVAYVYPVIGSLPVAAVDTGHVTRILEPIWSAKPETASRARGRIENVLDYATAHRWRQGENPARWRGHLENVLPKRARVRRVKHHAALPWREIGGFMAGLPAKDGVAALALRFCILTATRTSEVIGARWDEIDAATAVWLISGERTKSGREHRVPLSKDALAILREAAKLRDNDAAYIFPGAKRGTPLSNMAMLALLRRKGRSDLTTHGFRSTFRDWAAEMGRPADIAEAALGHVLGNRTVAAYQRGDLLERRRRLMADWAKFCGSALAPGATVVPLRYESA